jgi:hypothetical protein
MNPSLKPLLSCLDQLAEQFHDLRKFAGKERPGADLDPDLALTRACKMLEHVIRTVYERRTREPPTHFPTRYTRLEEIRAKHGSLADRVAPYFFMSDPLADEADAQLTKLSPAGRGRKVFKLALADGIKNVAEAPPALRCLFAQLEDVPVWLDWRLLDLGCRTHLRGGLLGEIVLATCCLPLAYRSAAGNKALVLTGRLLERAPRRMHETNRFIIDTFTRGGLRPYAPGWKTTVEVRMMHAAMRRYLRGQKKDPWNEDDLGAPINQVDMAVTGLLFSVGLLRQLRKLGFQFTAAETQGVMHLWRYSGYLFGIAPELLSTTETEGVNLFDLLLDLGGTSDVQSRKLTQVLMEAALPELIGAGFPWLFRVGSLVSKDTVNKQLTRFCYGLSHSLLGNALASELEYPRTLWRFAAPLLLRPMVTALELCRRLVPGGTRLVSRLGFHQIKRMMENVGGAEPKNSPKEQ